MTTIDMQLYFNDTKKFVVVPAGKLTNNVAHRAGRPHGACVDNNKPVIKNRSPASRIKIESMDNILPSIAPRSFRSKSIQFNIQ